MTVTTQVPARPAAARPRLPAAARVTQARVVVSEWVKLRSLRSTGVTFAAAVLAMIGIGLLIGWATNSHWAQMDPSERLRFQPVDRSLAGVHLAQLAIGVLGVLVITGEYATGMIRATFSAVPTRLPVLWAKAGLFAAVTLVLMLAASLAAFLAGQAALGSHGTSLSAPHAVRAVLGVALYLTVIGVLAVALGFIVRRTAGGIAILVGLLLIIPGLGQLLPASWQTHTLPYLPSNAGSALFTLRPDPGSLSPWTGFAVLCLWALGALALAAVLVKQRDA